MAALVVRVLDSLAIGVGPDAGEVPGAVTMGCDLSSEPPPADPHVVQGLCPGPLLEGLFAQLSRANEEQARTIRELEAPSEPPSDERGAPETTAEEPERAEEPRAVAVESQEPVQRPWWRRWFGG